MLANASNKGRAKKGERMFNLSKVASLFAVTVLASGGAATAGNVPETDEPI